MQLYVKNSKKIGATFLGKGIVGYPEMGTIAEVREVEFDEMDIYGEWQNTPFRRELIRTDTGYVFDGEDLRSGRFKIENYAPNWRKEVKPAF